MENILYIVTLCFAVAFVITFIVAAVYMLLVLVKLKRLKASAIANGYPAEKASKLLVTPKGMPQQAQNFKEGYGYGMFSFDWLLISNFGKDILTFTHDEKSSALLTDLKKTHKAWIRLLVLGLILLVLAVLTFFSISLLPGMELNGPTL